MRKALNPTSVLMRHKRGETQTQRGSQVKNAETAVMWPQVRECPQPPERPGTKPPLQPLEAAELGQ